MLVLAREDLSGTLWEISPFSRRKRKEVSQPDTDNAHRKGVESLQTHGISTFEALHKVLHSAGVERRRLATTRQDPSSGLAENIPPTAVSPALASLKQSQLQKLEDWVDRWQHYH